MNIIFKDNIANLDTKYTVLDLDTFRFPDGTTHTACCVVENIPISELSQTSALKDLHVNLIANYALRDWNYCEQAIEQLLGKWGGELDSFYQELNNRIKLFKTLDLDANWSPIIAKE